MVIADAESLQGHGTDGLCSAMATLPILPLQEETHMWQLAEELADLWGPGGQFSLTGDCRTQGTLGRQGSSKPGTAGLLYTDVVSVL